MSRYFVLYRDERRLCAALASFETRPQGFELDGQSFAAIGNFIHLSHIVDNDKRLLGFVVDGVENVTEAASWPKWLKRLENVELEDSWQAYIRLAEPWPSDWFPDTALLITGGVVLYGGRGEYAMALPDENEWARRRKPSSEFWRKFGFALSSKRVR